jgi:hypothetical protein
MRSISLGLVILMGSVFGAYAQVSNTPHVGGPGGAPFADDCKGDDVLIGYNVTQDKAMNTIAAVCQPQINGTLVDVNYGLTTRGTQPTAGGGPVYPRCPGGQAIFGLTIYVNKFDEIDSVSAVCVPLLPHTGASAQLGRTMDRGGDVRNEAIGCGNGVAIGLAGRSGQLIDSLGLKCKAGFPWHTTGQ